MENKFRSSCPVTSAIDIVGDKWTLVIIKQMLTEDKKTFKGFTESSEAIATNILSSRLKMLEEFQIIKKEKLPNNKKVNIYTLTEKGLALAPTIIELTIWSTDNFRNYHPDMYSGDQIKMIKNDKENYINLLIKNYKEKNWLK